MNKVSINAMLFSCRIAIQSGSLKRVHVLTIHSLKTEFQAWKEDLERKTDSQYVKATGQKEIEDGIVVYYYCNRSGFFTSKGSGIRHLKSTGTSRIIAHCTAAIIVTKKRNDQSISVYMCKTHYGHQCSLGLTRLQASQKKEVVSKLAQGISAQHIIDQVRESVVDKFEKIHLITRKDIANIERAYGLSGNRRHSDDATSVMLWVNEMNSMKNPSPVLIFKQQGKMDVSSSLQLNDFVLVIQTLLQGKMLTTFGQNIICIDSTHGTNGYDFSLTTVIIVDEFGEGYPVAWCLSNRTDLSAMLIFSKKLRKE